MAKISPLEIPSGNILIPEEDLLLVGNYISVDKTIGAVLPKSASNFFSIRLPTYIRGSVLYLRVRLY